MGLRHREKSEVLDEPEESAGQGEKAVGKERMGMRPTWKGETGQTPLGGAFPRHMECPGKPLQDLSKKGT